MLDDFLVYGRENHAMESVLRMQSVTRWHMLETSSNQSLAAHSANVALLAMVISATASIFYFDPSPDVVAAALVHDIAEVFTGDIPSHMKAHLKGLEEVEQVVVHPIFEVEVNANTRALIKLCDMADAVRYIRKHATDATGTAVYESLHTQMNEKLAHFAEVLQWPEHLVVHVSEHLEKYCHECSGAQISPLA